MTALTIQQVWSFTMNARTERLVSNAWLCSIRLYDCLWNVKHSGCDLFDRLIFSCTHQICLWRLTKMHLYCLLVKIKKKSNINDHSCWKKFKKISVVRNFPKSRYNILFTYRSFSNHAILEFFKLIINKFFLSMSRRTNLILQVY